MLFILAVVSSMLLFINCVFLMKRIKDDRDIAFYTVGGAVLLGIFVYAALGVIVG
ncbi:hypothetical protein [Desulfitobacterium metallireducens]|uniref:Uncharacterized protein n=1 Tax=Desulfitobacterium metallireducens DSM 15288 TaxID=871968 RepID=W0EGT3_9FIRM|nr:hypothetical protein [Desulfitobacterium metallireducens]AHF08414.1 hypothetical protein DESME_02190 [Desulfitobacterium metallireducens DSM 15288]